MTDIDYLAMLSSSVPTSSEYMDEIIEHLFVGGIQSSEQNWNKFDIIVNCTKTIPFHIRDDCRAECIRIPVNDDPDECDHMLQYIEETEVLQKIHQAIHDDKKVLVHCHAGSQRSCALVVCYLIQYHRMTPSIAINYVRMRRNIAFFGGVNFMQAIQQFYLDQT